VGVVVADGAPAILVVLVAMVATLGVAVARDWVLVEGSVAMVALAVVVATAVALSVMPVGVP
ncbi:hypothetical protein, partial [Tychonema sp. LEGE 07199]|uniref:hypothetical protein n=1 Tax=Tychonema sp. LEGE 07199 TaxID=1828668 RepID=UPI001D1567DF